MKEWMIIVAILMLALTAAYILQHPKRRREFFADYLPFETKLKGPDGFVPAIAEFGQGLPLADVLKTAIGLTNESARSCAASDKARQEELGGQYVQRTNNYKRDYPDDCSSLLSDFVGGFYEPKEGAVGTRVPCNGQC